MRQSRVVVGALIGCILLGVVGVIAARRYRAVRAAARATAEQRAPDSVRVRVQVLNGTRTRGLARRATLLLRDRGFDVVETGTSSTAYDTTLVIDLTGHPDWALRMARVVAPATIETRLDSSRYLDIAVILGTTWRPSALPFYP